jgi:hydrogenase-4 component E
MQGIIEALLLAVVLVNLRLLGSSRIGACVRVVAVQGIVLGLLTVAIHGASISVHVLLLAAGSMAIKGAAFPWLLFRAIREARVRRDIEPSVGYISSLFAGLLGLGIAVWLGGRLPLPPTATSRLVVPVALFTIFTGLFLIVARKKALMQVLGYLVLENGIYTFGVALLLETPLLVELGVLLDVFVAVFVMGITIFHINRTFDDIDTDLLSTLKG